MVPDISEVQRHKMDKHSSTTLTEVKLVMNSVIILADNWTPCVLRDQCMFCGSLRRNMYLWQYGDL